MYGMKFGIEIEAEGAIKENVYRYLVRQSTRHGAWSAEIGGVLWTIKNDGSLRCGSEIISDIMTEVKIPAIKILVGHLKTLGMSGKDRAGLHIHVGVTRADLLGNMNLFMKNWQNLLPRIERVFTPRSCRREYTKMRIRKQDWLGHRYSALNLSQSHHETVEFRMFDSQLDYRYIVRAINFSCAFTRLTLAGATLNTKPGESMEQMMKRELVKNNLVQPT